MLEIHVNKQLGAMKLAIDLQLASHGVLALFGRSGAGKSSVINMLAGLLQPDSGRIHVADSVLFDATQHINLPIEARRLGYVFQQPRLFPHLSVEGNLRYGLRRSAQRRAPTFRFDTVVDLLGLNALLTRRPLTLSGGEQQRVAIGRALLAQPRLLLLDEPLASLDQARRADILPYLMRVRDELGITMIYVSHQFEEVLQLASEVALMVDGRVVAQDKPAALSHHPELQAIIGADAMGTVIDSEVIAVDSQTGLATLRVGHGQLRAQSASLHATMPVRLHLLARDLILATAPPQGLSVRNVLAGHITQITHDDARSVMVAVDVGGVLITARITYDAAAELGLQPHQPVWLLIKAMTLRSHVYQVTQ